MTIVSFEEIVAWQKAKQLTVEPYEHTSKIRDFGFNSQLQRACVSIMNNIAEGFERKSNKEFKHFLYIAKGSCGEVRSMLILGNEIGYIGQTDPRQLIESSNEVSKILAGLIKTL